MSSSPAITFRAAQPADVPLILEFVRGLAEYVGHAEEATATPEDLQRDLFGPRPYAEAIFLCEDGVEVGFAFFFHNYSTWAGRPGIYLEDVFVQPEYRGRGYGKALMAEIARIAVERGCARFEWAVLRTNVNAQRFYRSLGAEPQEYILQRLSGEALEKLAGM